MSSLVHQPPQSTSGLSILSIPFDVIDHHIFKYLNASSMVACSQVCSKLRTHYSIRLSELPKNYRNQNSILQEIFGIGSLNLLGWFQARLGYPSIAVMRDLRPVLLQHCLSLVAEGCLYLYFWSSQNIDWFFSPQGAHIGVLEAAHAADCQLGPMVATGAAQGGQVHVLQWLKSHGCQIDASSAWSNQASLSGQLEVRVEKIQHKMIFLLLS